MSFSPFFRRPLAALLCAAMLAGPASPVLAEGLPDLGDASASDLSPAQERKLGESIMRDIRLREPSYVDDPEIEQYLNSLGGRLTAQVEETGGNFLFFVVRDDMVNAFAMFGGYIGVNTGLMLTAQTESELAGVLAHEISHVTQRHLARQVAKDRQVALSSFLAIMLAIVAARSNGEAVVASLAAGQAAAAQSQLAYSRDFEHEADRAGFELMERAGFDVHAMPAFFLRLQKAMRAYDSNAPVYFRTHPLTEDRIGDLEGRAARLPYKQVPDSTEFTLVRARLAAEQGRPDEAVQAWRQRIAERKVGFPAAGEYGLAIALQRAQQWAEAKAAATRARQLAGAQYASPMLDRLEAQLTGQAGDWPAAAQAFKAALQRHPGSRAMRYGYADALLNARDFKAARTYLNEAVQQTPGDEKLWAALALSCEGLGPAFAADKHRALAERYALNGQLLAAIDQLQTAQRLPGLDFYQQSALDARLREIKQQHADEAKQRRGQ